MPAALYICKSAFMLMLVGVPAASPTPPDPSPLFRVLGWTTYGVSVGDLASTEYGLHLHGCCEINPLQRNRGVRVASHIALPVIMNWSTAQIHRQGRRKTALWVRIAFNVGYTWLIVHNLREAGR